MADHAFGDLIEAITNAVVQAREATERQHFKLIDYYFEQKEQGDGNDLVAKTVQIYVPSMEIDGEKHEPVEVPLITLVPMNSLKIDEVSVEFDAHLGGIDQSETQEKKHGAQMALAMGGGRKIGGKNNVKVKVTMKGGDPPEGVVRINDRILKLIP